MIRTASHVIPAWSGLPENLRRAELRTRRRAAAARMDARARADRPLSPLEQVLCGSLAGLLLTAAVILSALFAP